MFATFPQFTKLTLAHKDEYEAFIRQFPPISEISFPTVMTWWNVLDSAAVAWLHGNLVISYWMPGDEVNSGLSIIGTTKMDESICEIFDHLKERGDPARLVHVSEFVISSLRYPEMFRLDEERDYHEYIVPVRSLYPLTSIKGRLRPKLDRTIARLADAVELKPLNLSDPNNREDLRRCAEAFHRKSSDVDYPLMTFETMQQLIEHYDDYDIQNVCVFVGGRLHAFFLYRSTHVPTYAIANYIAVDPKIPGMPELLLHSCAKWLAERGVKSINLDADFGSAFYRGQHLTIGRVNFFRKYTVEPKKLVLDFS